MATPVDPSIVAAGASAAYAGDRHAHTVSLPGGDWRLWRTVALRGAGFPAHLVQALAAPDAAAAADRCLAAQAAVTARLDEALARLRERSAADPEARTQIRALRRRLQRGIVEPGTLPPEDETAVIAALAEQTAAQEALRAAYDAAREQACEAIAQIAGEARFREAALWQTGDALRNATIAIQRSTGQRQQHALEFVALLIQRYAVKNDTCGFFGPAGWATVDETPTYLRLAPSDALMTRRGVYFEGWAIDALLQTFDSDPAVKRWAAPRLRRDVWLAPDGPYIPRHGRVDLSEQERRTLAVCDGERPAHAVAARLIADPESGLTTEAEVFEMLQRLIDRALLAWKVEVPPQLHPDRALAALIARIGDAETRTRCEATLTALVDARDRVADAAGAPERLGPALEAFNDTFSRLTGRAASRLHGHMYAARSPLYQDGCRAGSVALGAAFAATIGVPLTIVMDAARWVLGEVTLALNACLRECHAELRAQRGESVIDVETFLQHAKTPAWLKGAVPPVLEAIKARYQQAWTEVLGEPMSASAHELIYDLDAVAARARRLFVPRAASWSLTRHMSPDMMVSARGPEALARGEFHGVLGELHCGNTIRVSALAAQHPDLESLIDALAADVNGDVVLLRQAPRRGWIARGNPLLVPPTFWRYEVGDDLPSLPPCRSLPAGLLQTVDDGEEVRLQARDGSFACNVLELFHDWVYPEANEICGDIRPRRGHTPRLTLGALTLGRERWDLPPDDLAFASVPDRAARFAAVRAWARAHGMPRYVFYKSTMEPKPCFLDFDSPIYVDVFVRIIKRMEPQHLMKVVEMLPLLDETWLIDGHQTRYTCELRFVACADMPR